MYTVQVPKLQELTYTEYRNVPTQVKGRSNLYRLHSGHQIIEKKITPFEFPLHNTKRSTTPFRFRIRKRVTKYYNVNVPYTEDITRPYTVCVPNWKQVECKYPVCVPYWENVPVKCSAMVPYQKKITAMRTVCRTVPYVEKKYVSTDCGSWQTVAQQISTPVHCKDACGTCRTCCATRTVCKRVWIPRKVTREICCTKYRTETHQVPYCYNVTCFRPCIQTRWICCQENSN